MCYTNTVFLKKLATTLAFTSIALLKTGTPSIRSLADFLPLPYSKQVKTNRIWRLLNKTKSFNPYPLMKVLFFIASKLTNEPFLIIDFTSLKGYDIKLFIASLSVNGRSLPFYCKPLYLKDIHNLKFIESAIKELMTLIPDSLKKTRIILLRDRQFGTKSFLKFFSRKGIKFILRVKKSACKS